MQTAAIVLDKWKLDTFKRILSDAGYIFTEHPGVDEDTVTLKVKAYNMTILGEVIQVCNDTADQQRKEKLN